MTKRLFLFAGYTPDGILDDSLVLYVRELAALGDVVLCMDSNCDESELKKIKSMVLHADGVRHGEYDFGSYKRAYIWARDNLDLKKYNFVYMVNDSVYGPLFPLKPYLTEMESANTDAFGLVKNTKRAHPHIQSWFIGMRGTVFLSEWYDTFMSRITKLPSKGDVTKVYEHGFTRNVAEHGGTWMCTFSAHNRDVYNKIKKYYRAKMPFIKKAAFVRHNGRLGHQIAYVLHRTPAPMRDAIIEDARRVYGEKYTNDILSMGAITAFMRGLKYGIKKLLAGKL
jgi:lipopolysaccharide biosynthesis protein